MKSLFFILLIMLNLSACSWIYPTIKDSFVDQLSFSGLSSFRLDVKLPENAGVEFAVYYVPENFHEDCYRFSIGTGSYSERGFSVTRKIERKETPRLLTVDVPLNPRTGRCIYRPESIYTELNINGYFRTNYDQRIIVSQEEVSGADDVAQGLSVNIKCEKVFYLSGGSHKVKSLSHSVLCAGAPPQGDYWKYVMTGGHNLIHVSQSSIERAPIHFSVAYSSEERPAGADRWIRDETGWKVCLTERIGLPCPNPTIYQRFEMNGQECTVYPSCKE